MLLHVAQLSKTFAAVSAQMRSLFTMGTKMGPQALPRGECFAAVVARKGLFLGVNSFMVLQVALLREGQAAGRALKPPLLAVDRPEVLDHVSFMREAPIAHTANVGPVPAVSTLMGLDIGRVLASVVAEAALAALVVGLPLVLFLAVLPKECPRGDQEATQ